MLRRQVGSAGPSPPLVRVMTPPPEGPSPGASAGRGHAMAAGPALCPCAFLQAPAPLLPDWHAQGSGCSGRGTSPGSCSEPCGGGGRVQHPTRSQAPLLTAPHPRPHRETPKELLPSSRHPSLCSTATIQPEDTPTSLKVSPQPPA